MFLVFLVPWPGGIPLHWSGSLLNFNFLGLSYFQDFLRAPRSCKVLFCLGLLLYSSFSSALSGLCSLFHFFISCFLPWFSASFLSTYLSGFLPFQLCSFPRHFTIRLVSFHLLLIPVHLRLHGVFAPGCEAFFFYNAYSFLLSSWESMSSCGTGQLPGIELPEMARKLNQKMLQFLLPPTPNTNRCAENFHLCRPFRHI